VINLVKWHQYKSTGDGLNETGNSESKAERQEQKGMPELRKENETAVYWFAAL
jgi:hypothetical protein